MKKYMLLLAIIVVSLPAVSQKIFEGTQDEANDKLMYATRYLTSDTMLFKSLMIRDTSLSVVLLSDVHANALYAIMPKVLIDSTNKLLAEYASPDQLYCVEFNGTYLKDFSRQKKRKIKNIQDDYQKNMTMTFNSKVKYFIMQRGVHLVKAKRITDENNANFGKIVPDFGTNIPAYTEQPAQQTPSNTAQQRSSNPDLPTYPPVTEKTGKDLKAGKGNY